MKKVFDNIKLLISVFLPLGTGLYGFLLGEDVAAAIWGETAAGDMTGISFLVEWSKHMSIAVAFAIFSILVIQMDFEEDGLGYLNKTQSSLSSK